MSKRFILTENQINQIYKLLSEEKTQDEMATEFYAKLPCLGGARGTKFQEEGGKIVRFHYYGGLKGHLKVDINGNGVVIDGPYRKLRYKTWCEGDDYKSKWIGRAPIEREYEKFRTNNNITCIPEKGKDVYLRKNRNNELIISNEIKDGGRTWLNLTSKTYFIKGGLKDGEQGQWVCDNTNINYTVTTAGTNRRVYETPVDMNWWDVEDNKPLKKGMRDRDEEGIIFKIQEKLKELRFYRERPDGQYGDKTQDAVKEFQRKNGLRGTGEINQETITKLANMGTFNKYI